MLELWYGGELAGSSRVAIAIMKNSEGVIGKHIGLLYHESETGTTNILHLGWHHRLFSDSADEHQWIIPIDLDRRTHMQIAAFCRLIYFNNQPPRSIPYGFGPPSKVFDSLSGEYLLGPTGLGLTCASFVLAIFQSKNQPLIDYVEWPETREDDIEWQREIVTILKTHNADERHLEVVENQIGALRFRPLEVAAAAALHPPAAKYEAVAPIADVIAERLRQVNG